MSHPIIYDTATRGVLVINPLTDASGMPILPIDVPTAAAASIADTEYAKLSASDEAFTLAADDQTITAAAVLPVADQIRQQRVADAVVILNNTSVSVNQATRDAMARTIGVRPLSIPLGQAAVSTDIVLLT